MKKKTKEKSKEKQDKSTMFFVYAIVVLVVIIILIVCIRYFYKPKEEFQQYSYNNFLFTNIKGIKLTKMFGNTTQTLLLPLYVLEIQIITVKTNY